MISEFCIQANSHAQRLVLKAESWVQHNLFADFRVTAKFDWSPSRRSSRGGIYKEGPGINMAMYWAVPDNQGATYRFSEYPSFDSDRYIGGFYSKNAYDKLDAILVHEIAHAVQFFYYKKSGTRCTPHGPVFKKYYKILREEFVNHKLPTQAPLAKDYQDYVNNIQKNNLSILRAVLL